MPRAHIQDGRGSTVTREGVSPDKSRGANGGTWAPPQPVPRGRVIVRKRTPLAITPGRLLMPPLRRSLLSRNDERKVLDGVTVAYEAGGCVDVARAIYNENILYGQLKGNTDYHWSQAQSYRNSAAEEYRTNGATMRYAMLYSRSLEEEDQWKNAVRLEREKLQTLSVLADYYRSLGCENANSPNWPPPGSGGGSSPIGSTGLSYNCTGWEPWEISLDGGSTWTAVQGRECTVTASQA